MVRLRSEALLGGGGARSGGRATVVSSAIGEHDVSGPAGLARLLQAQGLVGLGLIALDAALGTGVLDRHAIEAAKALGFVAATFLLRPRDPRLFARLCLAWALLLLGAGVLLPLKLHHKDKGREGRSLLLLVVVVLNSVVGVGLALAAAARDFGPGKGSTTTATRGTRGTARRKRL